MDLYYTLHSTLCTLISMNEIEAIEIGQEALWVLIKVALPLMGVALIIGLSISLFQALTQIQEMTLSFVPKIIGIFFALMLFLPYIFNILDVFTEHIAEMVIMAGQRNE